MILSKNSLRKIVHKYNLSGNGSQDDPYIVDFVMKMNPHKLFDNVATSPSLKILFRLDGSSCKIFNALTREEQLKLTHQRFRNALVLNGATGEKYPIWTLNI